MRRAGFLALAAVPLLFPLAAATGSGQDVRVTAPTAGSEHRSGSSVLVSWHNGTGQEVDMWLVHGDKVRVSQLAAKVSAAASGEKATVLPDVHADKGYAIEVAAHDGGKRGYSPAFIVTDANQGPPSHHQQPVAARPRPCLTLSGCPGAP